MTLRRRLSRVTLLLAACVAASAPAGANTPAAAQQDAQSLFDTARKLYDEGRYEDACRTFEESAKIRRGIGVQFQLANCWERIGRTASARTLFLEVADATRSLAQYERERVARERARALESRLSYLRLIVRSPEPGLEIQRDGRVVGQPEWAAPIAVDAGEHEIRAVAPGKRPHLAKVTVHPGEAGTVFLEIPSLAVETPKLVPASAVLPVALPRVEAVLTPDVAPAPANPAGPDHTRRNVTIALAGVGAAAFLAGTAFAMQAAGDHSDAEAVCKSGHCTARQIALREPLDDSSRNSRTWAIVGISTGVGALFGAGYLFLTAPRRPEGHASRLVIEPMASPDEGIFGARIHGSL